MATRENNPMLLMPDRRPALPPASHSYCLQRWTPRQPVAVAISGLPTPRELIECSAHAQLFRERLAHWQSRCHAGEVFDGRSVALRGWQREGEVVRLSVTEHSYLEHRAISDVYRKLNLPIPLDPKVHAVFSSTLGLTLLVTRQGRLLAPKRGARVATDAGLWSLAFTEEAQMADMNEDFVSIITSRLLHEELGLNASEVLAASQHAVFGLAFDGVCGEWGLLARVDLACTPSTAPAPDGWEHDDLLELEPTTAALQEALRQPGREFTYRSRALARLLDSLMPFRP